MSTDEQDRRLINRMHHHMERKLAANQDKRHWSDASNEYLFRRLLEEVAELREAIFNHRDSEAVWSEAADVANFAAMIAENR